MSSRLNWTLQEQNLLKTLKESDNITSWKKIAQILNEKIPDSVRTGKQCRDRYINYVRFSSESPKRVGWTEDDDRLLFQKFQQHGTKWVSISSEMPDRSENNLKNRFYGAMRKIMRKIVKVQKQMKPKPKKIIKQRQLIKIFQECKNSSESQLYKKLLNLAIAQQDQINSQEVKNVLSMIHSYSSTPNYTNTNTNTNTKLPAVETNSFTTDDAQKCSSYLDDILMEIDSAQQFMRDIRQQKHENQENLNNFLKKRSLSLLKDSLRIDFSDMRNLEYDPQRQIADRLFSFDFEGIIY